MKVALVHPSSWPEVRRGAERLLHDLASVLAQAGEEVEIVSGTEGQGGRTVVGGIPVNRIRHRKRLDFGPLTRYETFGLEAWPFLVRHRFDLVVAMSPSAAIAGWAARQPTVLSTMGWPTAEYWRLRHTEARLYRLASRLLPVTTVLSSAAVASVRELTGRTPALLPAGVRLAEFPLVPGPRLGCPVVLFASWASEQGKGLDLLLRGFAGVLDTYPDARLRLAGGGDPTWALAKIDSATRQRIWPALEVDPPPIMSADVYGAAHVTVLPSRVESFGLVLLESLACGTPVVGSAVGGLLDILAGCPVGQLVPHGDICALTDAICKAVQQAGDPVTAQVCRAHAARFDWAGEIGARHLALYRKVSGG